MDTWPADTRPPASQTQVNATTTKGKRKAWQADNERQGYLHLKQGRTGPVTLVEQSGRLVWESLLSNDHNRRRFIARDVSLVYPPTRSAPLKVHQRSIQQVAQSNVNFLRNYFPDLYVMDGLLQTELTDDAEHIKKLQDFNPHVGNLLDLVIRQDTTSRKLLWLAFPTGETGCDLNLSPFNSGLRIATTFQPTVESCWTFDTPIQQIVSSPPLQSSKQSTALGVRTFNSTTIFDLKAFTTNRTVKLSEIATILPAHTGGQEIVDFHLVSTAHAATMVTESGSVYSYTHAKGGTNVSLLFEDTSPGQPFHRLATSVDDNLKFRMNETNLRIFDARTPATNIDVYTLLNNDVFTSMENEQTDWLVRACSTSQLLWFDRRYPGRPVLGYDHDRQRDKTLQVKTLNIAESGTRTFLTSKKNSMITVYDVSRNIDTDMINVLSPPYALSRSSSSESSIGEAYLHLPEGTRDHDVCIYRLSERGSISQYALGWSDEKEFAKPKVTWTEEVHMLEKASQLHSQRVGDFHAQENSEIDLWPIYEDVFILNEEEMRRKEEKNADATYYLIEDAGRYWQNTDEPAEHILTPYDILFRSGEEPKHASRADFLTGTQVNSKRGFRALSQGRLNVSDLGDDAFWSHKLLPTLNIFDQDICSNIHDTAKALHRYDLKPSDARSPTSLRLESEAREQLAVDLALSTDVFSGRDVSKRPSEESEEGGLETLTETLSLTSEPPALDFQYLRPITKGLKGTHEQAFPTGVRTLLQEWEVGADPEKYVLPPLIEGSDPESPSPTRFTFITNSLMPSMTQPPVIATTAIGPRPAGRVAKPYAPPLIAESQPMADVQPTVVQSSQPAEVYFQAAMFSSTQILPGPYGGRPQVKKPTKKRVGGF